MEDTKLLRQMFDACRADLEAAAEKWQRETIAALDAAQSTADSMVVASRLFHAQRALDRVNPYLPRRFVQLLESTMVERLGGPVASSRRRQSPDELALVDDDVVTESIEVSRIVARIALEAEWEIREAEDALSRRLGRAVTGERGSPLHPEAFARAVWRLTEEMSLNPDERAACLRAALGAVAALAKSSYACAVHWCGCSDASMQSFIIKRSDSQVSTTMPVDISLDRELSPSAIRAAGLADGAPAISPVNDPPALEARDKVFRSIISGIEGILSDPRFTPELKRVLSGLQMAFMRFALGSPEILYSPDHRLWSVVRSLADHALNHCLRDRAAHDDFILFADDRIQTLMQLHEGALRDLTPHLAACEEFVLHQPDQLIENEATAMQHFARLEDSRRKILGVALNRHRERISEAIGHTEMPFRLRQFLLADWAEVLARTELIEGRDSGCYGDYWQAAQAVISKMRSGESGHGESPARDIGPLLATLERGMASISVPSVEKHELASAFLQPGRRVSHDWHDSGYRDPAATVGRHTPARKGKTFWGSREAPAPAFAHSTAGLTSAVPASDADHWINSLREGMVIELFLLGTWFEARVTSIDATGNLFTFEDELAGRPHSLTRRAMLRLVREGLAGPQ